MSDEVEIIFPLPGILGGNNPEDLKERIISALKGRVLEAYTFGSFVRGETHFDSDIDLILIKDTSESFHRCNIEFADLLDIYSDTDILVYTPQEFRKLISEKTAGFWEDVTKDLVRLL